MRPCLLRSTGPKDRSVTGQTGRFAAGRLSPIINNIGGRIGFHSGRLRQTAGLFFRRSVHI